MSQKEKNLREVKEFPGDLVVEDPVFATAMARATAVVLARS